ncbi:MAG: class II glutamine amidotransferase [Bacillota bacterium]
MCSIFGTSEKFDENNLLLISLGMAGEERGTDATGIAWLENNNLKLKKDDIKSSEFDWGNIPFNADFYLGHTRKTTQGDEKDNYNNHPFVNKYNTFTLAHNGVITNDKSLKTAWELDETEIETDSYVIVQMLETVKYMHKKEKIDIDVIQETVELLQGSFALSILTQNKLFLLRHNKPLYIAHNNNNLTYASTKRMFELGIDNDKPINYFGTIIQQTEEDYIYEYDIKNNCFVNSKEFIVYEQIQNQYDNYSKSKNKNYPKKDYDSVLEEEDFLYNSISSTSYKALDSQYKFQYRKCDECGWYYRRDYGGCFDEKSKKFLCNECQIEDSFFQTEEKGDNNEN